MKVGLISPRGTERNQQNNIFFEIYKNLLPVVSFMIDDIEFIPNLGLLQIGAYLDDRFDVKYIDEDYIDISTSEPVIFDEEFDLVCLSACNNQAFRAYEIADKYREMGKTVVIGGFHPSALPHEAKQHADAVVIGEGEDTFPVLIEDWLKGELKPFYYSSGDVDLTKIPMPRYDAIGNITRFNKMPVFATRGCPRFCDYCCIKTLYGPRYRKKTIQQVVDEINELKRLYPRPYPFITFGDENLLADPEWSKELVRALIDLNIRWECYCDMAVADDDELLELLYESRCTELLIGFESVIPETLKHNAPWKAKRVHEYAKAIEKIQSHGIGIMGLFIVGFDQDGPDVFDRISEFIRETNLFDIDFAVLCPIPGTRVYDRFKAEGRILTENWNKYTWLHVNFQPKQMTPRELQEGLIRLFKEFSTIEMLEKRRKYFRNIYQRLAGENPPKFKFEQAYLKPEDFIKGKTEDKAGKSITVKSS
ncbi:MAG: B12-binding domain-containing radical SAM protein [Candidatus Eremiobacteraeota bacterium]|nr:B12-binding domain-containing radical SAM protein [Candidatus Eremiobacteraeota bacterium]